MRVLAIGTCRIYGAAEQMRSARRFPHRVQNPAEIERAVDLFQGGSHPPELSHLLSEHGLNAALNHPDKFPEILADLMSVSRSHSFDAYVIEVSSLRTHLAMTDEGSALADTVVAHSVMQREAELSPLYETGRLRRIRALTSAPDAPDETRQAMRRIKSRLAAPIVWVSHCGLSDPRPTEEHLSRTRQALSAKVSQYAANQGDGFVDPTSIVAAYGREAIFKDGGEDLYHYTDFAHARLARALDEKLDALAG